jgi:hypothetical protein
MTGRLRTKIGAVSREFGCPVRNLMAISRAAVALTRYPLANCISDAKSERTTDQQTNHKIRHDSSSRDAPLVKQLIG